MSKNVAGSAFLAVALFLTAMACSRRPAQHPEAALTPRVQGDTITFPANAPQLGYLGVERAPERKTVASGLNGRLAWDEDVTARVFPSVSGRVIQILVSPGQSVTAGTVLAKIHSPDFGQAQAEARKAVADLNTAERALRRQHDLFDHGAAAAKDVEEAEGDYARAVSEKERAFSTLALYGGNTSSGDGVFSLRSPVAGVVVEKSLNPGQEVRSEQVGDKPLFVITDPRRLWLFLDASESDVASLRRNQEVAIRARAVPGKTFHGRIDVIGEGLDPSTRTIKARCLVDNSEKLLRAEMYVTADVSSAASGVDVSTKAVFLKDNRNFVFVETAPGEFEKKPVTVGAESNGRSVILSGVSAGQNVVIDGCLLLESILEGESS
jgi:cobalt-zinc-cadmium efflux system membrane fusion protein